MKNPLWIVGLMLVVFGAWGQTTGGEAAPVRKPAKPVKLTIEAADRPQAQKPADTEARAESTNKQTPPTEKAADKPAEKTPPDVVLHSTMKVGLPESGGRVFFHVTDGLNHLAPSRLILRPKDGGGKPVVAEAPEGEGTADAPAGDYKAYVYVYAQGVPVMIDVQDIPLKERTVTDLRSSFVEGSGSRPIFSFDKDCDFVLDRVEMACGTNPNDAKSIPGKVTLPQDDRVFSKEKGWYRGEFHAHSSYGTGKEGVAELVRRAESLGLDFLAITDLNTLAASEDPAFRSNSVVLLPAMEWGDDKRGVALIYGPRTFPEYVDSVPQAQALVDLVQAQGGFIVAAHPCFDTNPWQWGLGFLNGVEVWCRGWNEVPPITLGRLDKYWHQREKKKLVYSIAFAAATEGFSANGQASLFYDAELTRGAKMGVIGGSNTASPQVPMAQPVTYVYAVEKSVRGILDGVRRGRTYVSRGLDGPKLQFTADVNKDKTIDLSIGGVVPLSRPVKFFAEAEKAKGLILEVLVNGRVFISKQIESDSFTLAFDAVPDAYTTYRIRVVGPAKPDAFGPLEVYATSSPIYAENLPIGKQNQKILRERVKRDLKAPFVDLPSDPSQGEIKPKWHQ